MGVIMEHVTPLLLIVIALVLLAEFVNGLTDAPNAIATVVATGVLSPRVAIILAVVGNIAGTFAGTAVAATIGKGIVSASVVDLSLIAGAMLSVVGWGFTAAHLGIPVSKSHALIAGLAGAGLAAGGFAALEWSGWEKVIKGLLISTFAGFVLAFVIGKAVQIFGARMQAKHARTIFDRLQVVSAVFMAFNHGMNDGQKFVGIFTLTLMQAAILTSFHVTWQVVLICALTMGLGTAFGGWKIMRTVGQKMVHLESWQGFAAEAGASSMIFVASQYGIPLSTTHTITTSITGSAASLNAKRVNWGVVRNIVLAWLITFPVCTLIAFLVCSIIKLF